MKIASASTTDIICTDKNLKNQTHQSNSICFKNMEISDAEIKRNEIIGLFTFAESLLHHALGKVSTYEPIEGYIYRIDNDVDDRLYIGSTVRDPDTRFSEHSLDSESKCTKFYKFIREANATMKMNIVSIVHIYIYPELLIREDHAIYNYNSIKAGLNMMVVF